MSDVLIIDLWPIVEYCWVCGEPSHRKGVPIYEGDVLPNDWPGEFGGAPACDKCFKAQQTIAEPLTVEEFAKLAGAER